MSLVATQVTDLVLAEAILGTKSPRKVNALASILNNTEIAAELYDENGNPVADLKKVRAQVASYNSQSADRHFAVREFQGKVYAVKTVKPAKRKYTSRKVVEAPACAESELEAE